MYSLLWYAVGIAKLVFIVYKNLGHLLQSQSDTQQEQITYNHVKPISTTLRYRGENIQTTVSI